jgi:hypothetical protein
MQFLAAIHPALASIQIRAIISLKNTKHAPADIILFDLLNNSSSLNKIADLMETTNGQSIQMKNYQELLLKVIFISEVLFTNSVDRKDNGSVATLQQDFTLEAFDIPICPICIHRIDPLRLGLTKPRNAQLCSKFCPPPNLHFHKNTLDDCTCPRQRLLYPWPAPSNCACCQTIQSYWNQKTTTDIEVQTMDSSTELTDLFCYKCAMQETLWVCVTCGFIGCGRYSNKHAAEHFRDYQHPYSLELATLRIWDYVGGEFVHRPDLLECPSSPPLLHPFLKPWQESLSMSLQGQFNNNNHSVAAAASPTAVAAASSVPPANFSMSSFVAATVDEKSPKKATMLSEEYEVLLHSALEEQAQHYEGEITRLRAELTAEQVDASRMTDEERKETDVLNRDIARLRRQIDAVSRDLLSVQAQEAGHRATSQRLLREQQVVQDLISKVKEETSREQVDRKLQIEELEQQIADLTANHRMRIQFSQDEELANAQFVGAQSLQVESDATRSAKKGGKKGSRRLFRK